jgi:broad specificity phosphatase PhoE
VWANALAVAHGGANMALLAGVLGLDQDEIPRIEQDLACVNAIDFFDDGRRGIVRLLNFSAHDPLKATLLEPSSERLKRVLHAYGEQLKGVPWSISDEDDPEI